MGLATDSTRSQPLSSNDATPQSVAFIDKASGQGLN